MAAGRQNNTKKSSERSNSTKKNSSAKRSGKNTSGTTSKARQAARKSQIKDEIMVLLAFAFALILILSNFNMAGSVGRQIKWLMFGLLGVVEYIFPMIMAFSLIFLVSNRNLIGVARIKTGAVYGLTILLAGAWQRICSEPVLEETSFGRFFTYSAETKSGGGFFGGAICKLLAPMGMWGSMVIIVILAIICIIIITEKSFIRGLLNVRESGSRMVHAAKQDYDIYKEHSQERLNHDGGEDEIHAGESQEEYLVRRREEKEARRLEKQTKREQQLAKKREQQEARARSRMERKALGVTSDTQLPREEQAPGPVDIHEIKVDLERHDAFSDDIYDPAQENVGSLMEPFVQPARLTADVSEERSETSWAVQQEENQPAGRNDGEAFEFALPVAQPEIKAKSSPDERETAVQKNSALQESTAPALTPERKEKRGSSYVFPPLTLLKKGSNRAAGNQTRENKSTALRLQQTLQNFGVKVTITDISCGPSVTRYELQPEQGVKVSKIVSLSDDIKLNLAAADIRIEAPIPGKAAIGIEVPNKEAGSVLLRELLETETFQKHPSPISFAAGKDIAGKTMVADIAKMPHLLIAGATGSGKSVCINTIIMSIIYKAHPDDVKLIMVDPKVVELSVYNGIPHLLIPVVTDPKKASGALNWAVAEMSERYKKFAQMNVRDLKGYNAKVEKLEVPEGEEAPQKMPQIVIIIDELADLMMVAPGEVEDAICRLAQLARAAGIHLVIATQRPSVNVITGLIKANVPSRIAFSVSSGVDSRTIIDMNGAEKLLGKGDMLFFPSGYPKPVRVQGAFVSDEEVAGVVDFLKEQMSEEVTYDEEITNSITSVQTPQIKAEAEEKDPYFADAGRFVIGKEKGSIGMLQRYYKIGFNRAGRIMDQLAEAGVVGPELGTKPRKIEMTLEEFEDYLKKSNIPS